MVSIDGPCIDVSQLHCQKVSARVWPNRENHPFLKIYKLIMGRFAIAGAINGVLLVVLATTKSNDRHCSPKYYCNSIIMYCSTVSKTKMAGTIRAMLDRIFLFGILNYIDAYV